MATLKDLMELAQQKIAENKAEMSAIGAVYKFVLDGDDGGTFLINLKDNPGVTEADGEAQCTIKMATKDFMDLIESRGDARQFFFMGKLRVEGNYGLAIKLRKLSELFR